jgi:hypothetical protein
MLSRRLVLLSGLSLLGGCAARATTAPTQPPPTSPPPSSPPPTDPPPPPSGSTPPPASVATPVRGTDLTEVWNLQFAGTGPRYALSNGKWSGALDAYLIGAGVVLGNTGQLYWNVGSSTKTLEKYDFTGAPQLHINGTGTANVRDCLFKKTVGGESGMACPIDSNASLTFTTTTLTVLMDHCTFDKAEFYQGAGTLTFSYCRFTNQVQGLGNSGFGAPGVAVMTYDHCYITGAASLPPPPPTSSLPRWREVRRARPLPARTLSSTSAATGRPLPLRGAQAGRASGRWLATTRAPSPTAS